MNKNEMTTALDAMLEQGNQLRASKLVPVLKTLADNVSEEEELNPQDVMPATEPEPGSELNPQDEMPATEPEPEPESTPTEPAEETEPASVEPVEEG